MFEMTSSQLAKDWVSMINLIESGKLNDTSVVKKVSVTPEKYSEIKKNANNSS